MMAIKAIIFEPCVAEMTSIEDIFLREHPYTQHLYIS